MNFIRSKGFWTAIVAVIVILIVGFYMGWFDDVAPQAEAPAQQDAPAQ